MADRGPQAGPVKTTHLRVAPLVVKDQGDDDAPPCQPQPSSQAFIHRRDSLRFFRPKLSEGLQDVKSSRLGRNGATQPPAGQGEVWRRSRRFMGSNTCRTTPASA